LPHNTKYNGCITQRTDKSGTPYKYIRIDLGKWELLHRYNWEQANGPIPKNNILRSINGDTLNCDTSNWNLITRAEHLQLNHKNSSVPFSGKQNSTNMSILKNYSDLISFLTNKIEEQSLKLKDYELQVADLKNQITSLSSQPSVSSSVDDNVTNRATTTCPICNKEFFSDKKHIKYCSQKCAYKANLIQSNKSKNKYKTYRKVTCKSCGKQFETAHSKKIYCSIECQIKYHKPPKQEKKCIICGDTFFSRYQQALVCSEKCRYEKSKRRNKSYLNPSTIAIQQSDIQDHQPTILSNTPTLICQICGSFFDSADNHASFCPDCKNLTPEERTAKYKAVDHLCNYKVFSNNKLPETIHYL